MIELRKPRPAKKIVDLRSKKNEEKPVEDDSSEDVLIHLRDDEIIAVYGSKDAKSLTPKQYAALRNAMLRALSKKDRPVPSAPKDVVGLDRRGFEKEKSNFLNNLRRSGK